MQTIIDSLDLKPETGRTPEETLTDYLCEKEMLIILDNCEHLINECAGISGKTSRNCPKIKIIATSREALNCSGEQTSDFLLCQSWTNQSIIPRNSLRNMNQSGFS
ncbi:MAG: hypothetical protein IPG78_16345 [Ignavibacteria bacterium]|nr:hypothetical protein [Ignavibacteria bacterium]